jgi:AcrR family transcriptional regulator
MARTKSLVAHQQVLDAAFALFAERGIDATSMDAVANAAGVSKATIYKHWPDKPALVLEALTVGFGLLEEPPAFDSGNLRRDFIDALTYQPAAARRTLKDAIMPHVMAYAAAHREFGEAWRERAIERPQRRLAALLARGVKQRQLSARAEERTAMALLLGPMLYWHIFIGRRSSAPVPRDLAEQVVDAFWRAFGRRRDK